MKFKKAVNHIETLVDGEVVLMHLTSGKFFSLDNVSKRVWQLLDQHREIDGLVAELCAEFDVTPEQCEADVAELLGVLANRDLLIYES